MQLSKQGAKVFDNKYDSVNVNEISTDTKSRRRVGVLALVALQTVLGECPLWIVVRIQLNYL